MIEYTYIFFCIQFSPGLDYGNGAYCNYPNGHNDYYSDVKWNSCK